MEKSTTFELPLGARELYLSLFQQINVHRCKSVDGFAMDPEPEYMLLCLQQELGELTAIITKLKRGFNLREQKKMYKKEKEKWDPKLKGGYDYPHKDGSHLEAEWRAGLLSKIGPELADILTYLCLTAESLGIENLMGEAITKFNQVSKDMESPFQISNPPKVVSGIPSPIVSKSFPEDPRRY